MQVGVNTFPAVL